MAALEEATGAEAPTSTSVVTPSGLEVEYTWAPKRGYRVRHKPTERETILSEWADVPSVTTVLGCLDKPGLSWWGQGVGISGVVELLRREIVIAEPTHNNGFVLCDEAYGALTVEDITSFLTQQKLTVNHTLTKAGNRGTSVHDAFEQWSKDGTIPHPEIYPAEEQGYIAGLRRFLLDWSENNECSDVQAEVMVGSIEHGYAGRYDLRCWFSGGPIVTRTYPKKPNKVEEIPAARYMLDLKTSSGVYPSHALQLSAYEGASVECGYEPTDYQAVVHVTKEGQYELVMTTATLDDFLAVRKTYEVMQKKMTV